MTYTMILINQIKAKLNKSSDYAVCKALDVPTSYMTKWKQRGSQFSNSTALKASRILGLPPLLVIARINKETCPEHEKADWEAVEEMALIEMDLSKAPTLKGAKKLKSKYDDFLILCKIGAIQNKADSTCNQMVFNA